MDIFLVVDQYFFSCLSGHRSEWRKFYFLHRKIHKNRPSDGTFIVSVELSVVRGWFAWNWSSHGRYKFHQQLIQRRRHPSCIIPDIFCNGSTDNNSKSISPVRRPVETPLTRQRCIGPAVSLMSPSDWFTIRLEELLLTCRLPGFIVSFPLC